MANMLDLNDTGENNPEEEINQAIANVAAARGDLNEVFTTVTGVLEETKTALQSLARQKALLEAEKRQLEDEAQRLEQERDLLGVEKGQLEEAKAVADNTIEQMTGEQKRLLEEYSILQEDLKKMTNIAQEAGQKEFNFQQVQAVLSIYTELLEHVWQSQPHFKVLYLLHGQKQKMSRQDLTKASGISPAMILRALFELRNANLVDYNEDTGIAKLVRRFLDFNTDQLDSNSKPE